VNNLLFIHLLLRLTAVALKY